MSKKNSKNQEQSTDIKDEKDIKLNEEKPNII